MAPNDQKTNLPQYITDQRVEIKPAGEARKGANVLHTSDVNNPAINPFVPIETQVSQANNQATNKSTQGEGNNQSKE
jgi:hypothetical protein